MFVALPLFRQRLLALLQDRLGGPQFLLQLLGLALAGDQPVEVSLALLALPCQVVQALCQPLQLRGRLQESQFFRQRPLVQLPIERGQLASQFLLLLATLAESFLLAGIALAQTDQGLSQPLEGLLGADLLLVVVFTEGGEQLLGMVIGMLLAAADRAGLAVHQAGAQLLDAGAAGQTLALEQLAGDLQGLLRRLHLLGALAALSFQVEQCLLLLDHTLVEFAQASSQTGALVEDLLPFLWSACCRSRLSVCRRNSSRRAARSSGSAAMEGGPLRLQAFERFPAWARDFSSSGAAPGFRARAGDVARRRRAGPGGSPRRRRARREPGCRAMPPAVAPVPRHGAAAPYPVAERRRFAGRGAGLIADGVPVARPAFAPGAWPRSPAGKPRATAPGPDADGCRPGPGARAPPASGPAILASARRPRLAARCAAAAAARSAGVPARVASGVRSVREPEPGAPAIAGFPARRQGVPACLASASWPCACSQDCSSRCSSVNHCCWPSRRCSACCSWRRAWAWDSSAASSPARACSARGRLPSRRCSSCLRCSSAWLAR